VQLRHVAWDKIVVPIREEVSARQKENAMPP